jgi:filamentous hemagglutinin family protein
MNYSSTKRFYLKLLSCIAVTSLIHSHINPAIAQITPDTTLPINTTIRVNSNISILEAGTRVKGNLFHSFREFSVINGNEVFFNNPLDIRNIITRVTGQSPSDINGIIKANGAANLFLINPNGIIFGENARLDFGGSFVGSTANSLLFDNGWEYSATNPNSPPLLTVNVPVGLQFGRNPGAIEVRGSGHQLVYARRTETTIQDNVSALKVPTGNTFALMGGDIFIKGGNLNVESGKIFLGSVISPDLVRFTVNGTDLAFEYLGVEKFGNIKLSQKASVDVSGERGGFIQIQSQRFSIQDGASVLSITTGSQQGKDIVVNTTELVELAGESADGKYASSLLTESQGAGSSGNVIINTQKLTATGGAYVSTIISSSGNGGKLTVTAPQTIELSDVGIVPTRLSTRSSRSSSGSVGNLNIKTGRLIVKNGATITNIAQGEGNGGELSIKTGELIAQDGGQLGTGAFSDKGQAGKLTIDATSSVELIGIGSFDSTVPSGLFTASGGNSNSGNATINTPLLQIINRAVVSTNTFGAGRSGDLTINTGELIVRNGRIIASTSGEGQGGNVTVNAALGVEVNGLNSRLNNGLLSNSSTEGNAGSITINTPFLQVLNRATVDASTTFVARGGDLKIVVDQLLVKNAQIRARSTGTGTAGNLTINARNAINLDDNALLTADTRSNGVDQAIIAINSADLILRRGSNITTNATGSDVIGGNININADNFTLLERSNITANSTDARGGKINIQAQGLFQSPDSTIAARGATQELSGTVNINSTLDPGSVLKEIPLNLVDPSRQISSNCVPGTAQNRNSFTVTGRGGIPANSNELLQDTSTIAAWVTKKPKPESEQITTILSSVQPNFIPQPIVEANEWLVDNRGQVHLVATNEANYIPPKVNVCPN